MVFYEYSTGEVLIIHNGMNKWTGYKHVENACQYEIILQQYLTYAQAYKYQLIVVKSINILFWKD
jgi:hypothetical protein